MPLHRIRRAAASGTAAPTLTVGGTDSVTNNDTFAFSATLNRTAVAGDTLFIANHAFDNDADASVTASMSGWTKIGENYYGVKGETYHCDLFTKSATGGETSASGTLVLSFSGTMDYQNAVCFSIDKAATLQATDTVGEGATGTSLDVGTPSAGDIVVIITSRNTTVTGGGNLTLIDSGNQGLPGDNPYKTYVDDDPTGGTGVYTLSYEFSASVGARFST